MLHYKISIAGVVFLCVLANIGCHATKMRPDRVVPNYVPPNAPLLRLSNYHSDRSQKVVFILGEKVSTLSPEAAPIAPILARSFGILHPLGIYYYPARVRGGVQPGPKTDVISIMDEEWLREIERRHTSSSNTPPDIVALRVSASMDRDVYQVRENKSVRALAEAWGGYIESDVEWGVEESVSVLTVSLTVQEVNHEVTPLSIQIRADVYKRKDGSSMALFVYGSGANSSKEVVLTQGLGDALEVCVARAVLMLCSRYLDTDFEEFLTGEIPPLPDRVVPEPRIARASGDASRQLANSRQPKQRIEAVGPQALSIEYSIETEDGHIVGGDPVQLSSGDQFHFNLASNLDCFVYFLQRQGDRYGVLYPVPELGPGRVTRGMRTSIPAAGNFTLDESPGMETLLMIASAQPIAAIDSMIHGPKTSEKMQVFDRVVQNIDREVNSIPVVEKRLQHVVRLEWPIAGGVFTGAAKRIAIHHR